MWAPGAADLAPDLELPVLSGVFPGGARRGGGARSGCGIGSGGGAGTPIALTELVESAGLAAAGRFRPGELRVHHSPAGTVLAVGQCLAGEGEFAEGARRLLNGGPPTAAPRWPGSCLCLVVRPDGLTAFVDPAGQYPLYYTREGERTRIATRPEAAAAPGSRRPDVLGLAAYVVCPGAPVLDDDRALLAGVGRLGGGQALRITAAGQVTRWSDDTLLPDDGRSFADAAEELADALDRAVRLRARTAGGRLTADFSGGMDSTSLAFLALRHLPGPLPAVTYDAAGSGCDDLPYARRFAALDGQLELHEVRGDTGSLPYAGLAGAAAVTAAAEPSPAAASVARTRLRLRAVAGLGSGGAGGGHGVRRVHLGGEGGDALLTASPAYLADLIRRGRTGQALRAARTLARSRDVSPASVLARAARLARTSPGAALRRTAAVLDGADPTGEPDWRSTFAWWPDPGPELGWLTRGVRRDLAASARARAAGTWAGGGSAASAADRTAREELRTAAACQRWLADEAAAFGVWPQAPFLDAEVVRACLRLPARRRAAPPEAKPLLRAALAGRVPAPVLARRSKGDYSEEDYRGVRAAGPALHALLAGSRLADLGVVDPAAVAESLARAQSGVRAPLPALNRLLAAELWLRGRTWD